MLVMFWAIYDIGQCSEKGLSDVLALFKVATCEAEKTKSASHVHIRTRSSKKITVPRFPAIFFFQMREFMTVGKKSSILIQKC